MDLTRRSKEYLKSMDSSSAFLLPRGSSKEFDIVTEEALHLWIMEMTSRKLQLSYDQMLRIRNQIHSYPDRLQWTLDIGGCWRLCRNGDALTVFSEAKVNDSVANPELTQDFTPPWQVISHNPMLNESPSQLQDLSFGPLPINAEKGNLQIKMVKEIGNIKFIPSWRKGRSAIKIKEFLRGQKVPLHLRDEAMVLCLSDDSPRQHHALAVYLDTSNDHVDDSGRWIVNAEFAPQDDLPVTKVVLGKISHIENK